MAAENQDAIDAAMGVMDAHLKALNAKDPEALAATLHFPHHRLASGGLQTWETPARYLADFFARAGAGWSHSQWDKRDVIAAGPDKVHLDVTFTRFRGDGSALGTFRSLWILTRENGVWAAALRSSFAK